MILKVCGITIVEDALAAVEAGANALGFNFYERSPRYISPDRAAEVGAVVPSGVLKVGVFVNESPVRIATIAKACALDAVQLHGDELAADFPAVLRVWKALRVTGDFQPESLGAYPAEAFVLDSGSSAMYGGTGHTFDWARARSLTHRIIVAGGLGPDNVAGAIRQLRPWGVDACSRIEFEPGRKDHRKMAAFLDAARTAYL